MARKSTRFLVQQKIALGVFIALAAAALGYLIWLLLQETPGGEFVEDEHYQLLEKPRRIRSDKIEVMEFFSYSCVHCYNFDPDLTAWAEKNKDIVTLVRTPAVPSDYWRLLGRGYYTMEQLGITREHHMPFFRAIHDTGQTFNSPERLFDYFERAGVEGYETAFHSPTVANQVARADQMNKRLQISTVPSLVVQGKYLVKTSRTIGPQRMLVVMDYLVQKELNSRQETSDSASASSDHDPNR